MDGEWPQLVIKVADEELVVDAAVVRAYSAVAYHLPASASVWDLSGLRIDGEPVKRETLIAWLNFVYVAVHGTHYRDQTASVLATDLYQLLAFADSIASRRGIYLTAISENKLRHLCIQVQGGAPWAIAQCFHLLLDGRSYWFSNAADDPTYPLRLHSLAFSNSAVSEHFQSAARAQAVMQVEQLLYIGYKLKLEPLLQRVHMFTYANVGRVESKFIPSSMTSAIFSPRVMDAAGYNEDLRKKAWISAQLQQHHSLLDGPSPIFDLSLGQQGSESCSFRATLARDWNGLKKGDGAHIVSHWPERDVVEIRARAAPDDIYIGGGMMVLSPPDI